MKSLEQTFGSSVIIQFSDITHFLFEPIFLSIFFGVLFSVGVFFGGREKTRSERQMIGVIFRDVYVFLISCVILYFFLVIVLQGNNPNSQSHHFSNLSAFELFVFYFFLFIYAIPVLFLFWVLYVIGLGGALSYHVQRFEITRRFQKFLYLVPALTVGVFFV